MSFSLAPTPPLKTGLAKRIDWMDTLRGLSLVLVMINHSLGLTYDNLEEALT